MSASAGTAGCRGRGLGDRRAAGQPADHAGGLGGDARIEVAQVGDKRGPVRRLSELANPREEGQAGVTRGVALLRRDA